MTTYDVAVIGAGPAGASAALYLARGKLSTLVVDADKGITRRALVNNHLGLMSITGPELVDMGHRQAAAAGAVVEKADVASFARAGDHFDVVTADGRTFAAKQLVLCLGAAPPAVAKAAGCAIKPGTEPRIAEVLPSTASGPPAPAPAPASTPSSPPATAPAWPSSCSRR